jgi:hypothetical protein
MPKYITLEADLDFPMPSIYQIAAQLRAMYDGRTPIKAAALAKSYELAEGAIAQVLRRAEQFELVRQVPGQGWIPL